MPRFLPFVIAAFVFVSAAQAASVERDALYERAAARLQESMAERHVPGMTVAVGNRKQILWSAAFGKSDLEQDVPARPSTRFRIGSISKPLAASVLAVLLERQRISMDDSVEKLVPDFPPKRFPIRVRHLASNTSGIRHYWDTDFRNHSYIEWKHYATVRDGLEVFEHSPLQFEPGTDYLYSSYGWNLLAAMLESAGGKSYPELLEDLVLDPLGLADTHIDHHFILVPNRTRFYAFTDDTRTAVMNAPFTENSYKWAAGGVVSTSENLVRFGQSWIAPGIFSQRTRDLMWTGQRTTTGKETGYGYGWFVGLDKLVERYGEREMEVPEVINSFHSSGVRIIEHRGGQIGGSAMLIILPDEGIVIAGMWNIYGLGLELAEQMLLLACEVRNLRQLTNAFPCETKDE